jgi:uncharacterized protein
MWYSKISKAICISILVAVILPGIGNAQQNNPESMDSGHGPDRERSQKDYWPFPNPDAGYVSDHANLLSDEEQEKIERWLWQIESKTGVEIIVMTIYSIDDYAGTPNDSIEEFATALFNTYGIGNMPANNGVLLLVAVSDRKARIELGAGYGRSRDADARKIMNSVITPKFKNADYAEGITDGVKAIALEFAQARIGLNWPLIVLLAAVPILVLIAISLFMSGKRGWGWVCIGLLLLVLLAIFFVVRKTLKHMPRSSSSSWSSGGLGGFGGGFSGGGGATGSW